MRYYLVLILFSSLLWAQNDDDNSKLMLSKTKDALLSYDIVEDRANQLLLKLQNLTLGEYADELMLLSPAFTGKIEFKAMNMTFYYKHFSQKAGVKYIYRF